VSGFLAWMAASASAAEAPDEREPDEHEAEVSEEIVVAGQRLSSALDHLHSTLRRRGYLRILRSGHRAYYFTPRLWKPWAMVHDEGFARVRGVPVVPVAVSGAPPRAFDRWGEPLPQLHSDTRQIYSTVTLPGRVSGRARDALVAEIEPALAEVRQARWELARPERRTAIREALVAIWLDEVAPDGTVLPDAMSRRWALAALWCNTAPTESGAWARALVADFVDARVQPSDHPFRADEVAATNAACPFEDDAFAPAPAR
jgi:hypothetical protein